MDVLGDPEQDVNTYYGLWLNINILFGLVQIFMSQSIAVHSIHLTTIFSLANLTKQLTRISCTYFCLFVLLFDLILYVPSTIFQL